MTERQRLIRRIEKAQRRLERGVDVRAEVAGQASEKETLRRLQERLSAMNGR